MFSGKKKHIQSSTPKQPVILQVLPEMRTGGVERGTIEIAAAIVRAGWTALVASAGGQLVPQLAYVGATHVPLPIQTKSPFKIWDNQYLLLDIIKKYHVDIVHARSRAPAWSAYLACRQAKRRCHFVTTFHGVYGLQPPIKRWYNEIMTKGERVIAISQFIADHIFEHYHVDRKKVSIIHRGVDFRSFNPESVIPQRMVDLAQQWRLPEDVPLIVMPGRITRWKGQHVFVEALSMLPHRNFLALIIGDDMGHPHYRVELEKLIIQKGLEGHVRLVGNTTYMAEAYTLAHLVVAPSIEPEAFGRVPVEAQAMGRLVIATNHGGARETIIDGETGWLVEPNDPRQLSDRIQRALTLDEQSLTWMSNNAVWHMRENFSSEKMCQKTIALYQEVLGM